MKKILIVLLTLTSLVSVAQTPQLGWGYNYGNTLADAYGRAITTDPSGNVITISSVQNIVDFDPGAGSTTSGSTGRNVAIQKLDAAGNFLWSGTFNTSAICLCFPSAVATDASGNIYVGGNFDGSVDFDPGAGLHTMTAGSFRDAYIVKLNSDGDFVWAVQLAGSGQDEVTSIVVDASGNVFAGGNFTNTLDLNPGAATSNVTSFGGEDMFLVKLNSSGTFVWGYRSGGSAGDDNINDMAIDSNGDILIAGQSFLTSTNFFSFAPGSDALMASNGNVDATVLKVDGSSGQVLWGSSGGGSSTDYAYAVTVDASNNVYLGGSFQGSANLRFSPGAISRTSQGSSDAYVVKISSTGFHSWVRTLGSTGFESVSAMDFKDNNFYILGRFSGVIDFDNTAGTFNLSASGTDGFLWKIDDTGTYEWAGIIAGTTSVSTNGVAVDGGSVYTVGSFEPSIDVDPSASTLTLTSASATQNDIYHFKLSTNNDPTNIGLSNASINENNSINATIGSLSTTDADAGDTHTYSLVSGTGDTDNGSFNISGSTLRIGISANHEVKDSYSVRIQTSDGNGGAFSKAFTISIGDVQESPTNISVSPGSIDENQSGSVGTMSATDPDAGDSHTFALVAGSGDGNNDLFTVSGSNLLLNKSVSHESNSTLSVRLRATDQGSNTYTRSISITINDVPEAPTNVSLNSTTIAENSAINATVGTLSTTDQDAGETYTYSLVSGSGDSDNASFNISGNQLRASQVFDFETKSSYSVRIRTNDGNGGTFTRSFSLSVTDVSEAPTNVNLSASSIAENSAINTVIGSLSSVDQDAGETYTYALVSGSGDTDNASFNISGNQLRTSQVFDFETKSSYSVRVQTNDGNSGTFARQFTITVTNVSEAPTNISLNSTSIAENSAINTSVGTLSTVDEDAGETYTYALVSGSGDTDNASFNISGSQLRASQVFDFETKSSYSVRIRTNDGNGGTFTRSFSLSVTNVSEAPTNVNLSASSIAENSAINTGIGLLSTVDQDAGETYTYSLVSGAGDTDNAAFNISGNQLRNSQVLDFETKSSYSVRVQTNDGNSGTFARQFTITVTNVSEAPTNINLSASSVAENSAINTVIGSLSSVDQDAGETYTYALVSGSGDTDNAAFNISGNQLRTSQVFDFETKSSYSVRVQTNDGNGGIFARSFSISVTNVSEAPTNVSLGNTTISENSALNTTVGFLFTTDEDAGETYTYSLVSGAGDTDNGAFNISGSVLRSAQVFNFEVKSSYSVRVQTNDGNGGIFAKQFNITITDASESPSDLNLSATTIQENNAVNAVVGTLSTVDEDAGETYTYSLVAGTGGADNSSFNILGNSLRASSSFDFETKSSYSIRLKTDDGNSGQWIELFTITVTNQSENPTDIGLDNNSIQESLAIGSLVGNLSTTDPDAGETYTYSLVSGTGDTDNASFSISGNKLESAVVFDFETKNSYSVRIQTDDGNGNQYAEAFTISISDVPAMITDIGLTNDQINENNATPLTIGSFSTIGEEVTGSYTYSLVPGAGSTANSSFFITGNNLRTSAVFDHEIISTASIRVRTDDGMGASFEKIFIISVNDVNEAPTDIQLSSADIDENNAINDVIGSLSSTDVDAGSSHTYTLVAGTGDTDNGSFNISGSQLRASEAFDFETKSSYSIRIQTNDGNGGTYSEAFSITVNDEDAMVTDIGLSNHQIDENNSTPFTVGTFSTIGSEITGTYTYSLVAGTGSTANSSFFISGNDLRTSAVFNHEIISTASIRVRTDDGMGSSFEKIFVITVNDVNEAPTDILLSANDIDENDAVNENIGMLSSTDEDAGSSHTYTLVSGTGDTDNGSFNISGNSLRASESFNFETKSTYTVRIQSNDGNGGVFEEAFTIVINDVSEDPMALDVTSASIDENNAINATVGSFITTDEDAGETYTYTLVSGPGDTDNSSFNILGNQLRASASVDFESQNSFLIRVQTDDGNGGTLDRSFLISVNDVNEEPTNISLSNKNIDESNPVGSLIGTLTTDDVDAGDTHTYTVSDGCSSCRVTESANFEIVGNELRSKVVFDFETTPSYGIEITTTDANGLSRTEGYIITINDIPASVTAVTLDQAIIDENKPASSLVGTLSTSGEDLSGSFTYSLVSGTGDDDNGSFSISGDQLMATESFNFEVKNSYSILVNTNDGNGHTLDQQLTITIGDVSESSDANMLTFELSEQTGPAVIDNTNHTVAIEVVRGTDLTNLTPTITISAGASITPEGAQDFSSTVTYTITAEEPTSTQDWQVTVTGAKNDATDILTFTLTEQTGAATIDATNHTIALEVAVGTDLTGLTPEITLSEGASISPTGAQDFSNAVTYTVTAENGATQDWTATVSIESIALSVTPAQKIKVYPNPTTEWITVQGLQGADARVQVVSLQGHTVLDEFLVPGAKLSVRDLSSGTYLLRIINNNETTTTKILVSR